MDRIGAYRELGGASEAAGDPNADLRGREVVDRSGEQVGNVVGLLLDERTRRVGFLRVAVDPLLLAAGRQFLVPVEAIARVEADRVHLDALRERVFSAPAHDEGRRYPPEHFVGLLDYYGRGPSVVPGVTTPLEPTDR